MTTDRYKNFRPDRPTQIVTTQRVVERCDWDEGVSDTYFDLYAREDVPRYEHKVDTPPRNEYEDD
jgi:hypothetical protein